MFDLSLVKFVISSKVIPADKTFNKHHINIDAMSLHHTDVDTPLFLPYVFVGIPVICYSNCMNGIFEFLLYYKSDYCVPEITCFYTINE